MATNATGLVEKLKGAALRMGTEGVRVVVEGTVAAVKAMDQLQERLKQERVVRMKREPALERPRPARPVVGRPAKEVRAQARATAARVLEEARAVEERLKEARPAPQPLKVSAEERPAAPKRSAKQAGKTPRTQGRKTMPTASATAPRRATARPDGFKAKRGQKHEH